MLGAMFTQLAVTVSNAPILVSVTRSMEIVMALFLDTVIAPSKGQTPIDYTSASFVFKIVGSLVVFLCVVGIAAHDNIIDCGRNAVKQVLSCWALHVSRSRSRRRRAYEDMEGGTDVDATEADEEDQTPLLATPTGGYGSTQN